MKSTGVGPALLDLAGYMVEEGFTNSEAKKLWFIAYLTRSLEKCRGNVCRAARDLEVHRNTLSRELDRLGLRDLPRRIRRGEHWQQSLFPAELTKKAAASEGTRKRARGVA